MAHDGCSNHQHDHTDQVRGLFVFGIILNLAFVVIEFISGYIANSNALFADAGHNLFDVMGLFVAWFGFYIGRQKQYHRISAGVSLANSLGLVGTVIGLGAVAVQRFSAAAEVNTTIMIVVASVGIVINYISAHKFKTHQHDLNVRGAYLHLMADAAISLGVVISGFAIRLTGYVQIDSIVTLAICAVILITSIPLVIKSLRGVFFEL